MRYPYTLIRLAKVKIKQTKNKKIPNIGKGKGMEQLELRTLLIEMQFG